jgi:hypothetical protein
LIVLGGWAPDKLRRHFVVKDLVRDTDVKGKTFGIKDDRLNAGPGG